MDHPATQQGGANCHVIRNSCLSDKWQASVVRLVCEGGGRLSILKKQAHSSSSKGVELTHGPIASNKTAACMGWGCGLGFVTCQCHLSESIGLPRRTEGVNKWPDEQLVDRLFCGGKGGGELSHGNSWQSVIWALCFEFKWEGWTGSIEPLPNSGTSVKR